MKKIAFAIVGILALVGIGIFISLHTSKEKPKTQDDLAIQELIRAQATAGVASGVAQQAEDEGGEVADGEEDEAQAESGEVADAIPGLTFIARGALNPDAEGSDALHRGSGAIDIIDFGGSEKLIFNEDFKVTNGPDYMVYLVRGEVPETKQQYNAGSSAYTNLGRMRQFSGYQTFDIPADEDLSDVTGVVIWCEQFGIFISSGELVKQ